VKSRAGAVPIESFKEKIDDMQMMSQQLHGLAGEKPGKEKGKAKAPVAGKAPSTGRAAPPTAGKPAAGKAPAKAPPKKADAKK
jgi:hypothetical protein